jgi:AcrR family transcriptional regulator
MPRRARTAPRREPLQKRAEDTVDVLLRATEIALGRHGFHATTTNKIAEIAGVSIGTLYHYFPTKEALVQAIVERQWRAELDALLTRAHLLDEMPLADAIRTVVVALAASIGNNRELVSRWYAEAANLGDLQVGLAMTREAARVVERALLRHPEAVRPTDLAFASELVVVTALHAVRTASRDYPDRLADGSLAEEVSQMLSRYLLKDPPA